MLLFSVVLGAVLVLYWVALPLISRPSSQVISGAQALATGQAESILRSLKTLNVAHKQGKLADDDFNNMERRLMVQLARIYHQRGLVPSVVNSAETCSSCGTPSKKDYCFCPRCGRQALAA